MRARCARVRTVADDGAAFAVGVTARRDRIARAFAPREIARLAFAAAGRDAADAVDAVGARALAGRDAGRAVGARGAAPAGTGRPSLGAGAAAAVGGARPARAGGAACLTRLLRR